MSDHSRRRMQGFELGADEEPIILPPAMCAQALHANRFSIVGVLVNPSKQSMQRLIVQMPIIWGLPDVLIGRMIDARSFQFVFPSEQALIGVLQRGPWSFADWTIVANRWDANVTAEDLKMVQFWVQIKGIPPHYLSREIIGKIGGTFAHVLAIDFEDSTSLTDHVWVLVHWNIDNPLRFKRKYQFAEGEIYMLSFRYDRLANFCVLCGMLSHDEKDCPLSIVENDGNKKTEDDIAGSATGLVMDERKQAFTNAFTGLGMRAGPSGEVSVPNSYIPPIDCDKIAETLRYLKAKLDKAKLHMGHKWSPTDPFSQPENFCENDLYNPITGWPVFLGTEPMYHPMEERISDDRDDEFIVHNPTIGGVSGAKRKRKENDKDTSIVVLYPGRKKGKCEFNDLDTQRRLPSSDGSVEQVQEGANLVSNVVMNPGFKLEDSESADSSDYDGMEDVPK